MINVRENVKRLYSFWKGIRSREISASLAFYFITGFTPLLCLALFFCGRQFPSELFDGSAFFGSVFDFAKTVNTAAVQKVASGGAILLLTSVYSSVSLFAKFKKCGEILYKFEEKRKPLRLRIVSLAYVGITVVLFTAVGFFFFLIKSLSSGAAYKIMVGAISVALVFCLLVILNMLVCPYKLSIREVWGGAAITLAIWMIICAVFGFYLDHFANYERAYGAFAGVFSFIFFVYFLMQAFTFGVAYNILKLGRLKPRTVRNGLLRP